MRSPFIATMSSRGQVVIPAAVRKAHGFGAGTGFIVVARGDTLVLQRLKEPPWKAFDDLTKAAAAQGHNHDLAMQGFAKFLKKLRSGR